MSILPAVLAMQVRVSGERFKDDKGDAPLGVARSTPLAIVPQATEPTEGALGVAIPAPTIGEGAILDPEAPTMVTTLVPKGEAGGGGLPPAAYQTGGGTAKTDNSGTQESKYVVDEAGMPVALTHPNTALYIMGAAVLLLAIYAD